MIDASGNYSTLKTQKHTHKCADTHTRNIRTHAITYTLHTHTHIHTRARASCLLHTAHSRKSHKKQFFRRTVVETVVVQRRADLDIIFPLSSFIPFFFPDSDTAVKGDLIQG